MKHFLLFFLCVPSLLHAQSFEGAISGGVSRFSNNGDLGSGFSLDSGTRIALRATVNPYSYLGFEVGYAYNRAGLAQPGTNQTRGMAVHQGMFGTLAYATPEGSRIRPFVVGGIHFSNFVPPGQTAQFGQGVNKFGINYGGGIKVRVAGPWHVRFDLRQFNTGVPFGLGRTGRFIQNEVSAGIGYAK